MSTGTFSVWLDGNKTAELSIDEYHPVDRAAYQLDPGWTCFDLNNDTEYFVSVDGTVYVQPENRVVGVCPHLRAEERRRDEREEE